MRAQTERLLMAACCLLRDRGVLLESLGFAEEAEIWRRLHDDGQEVFDIDSWEMAKTASMLI